MRLLRAATLLLMLACGHAGAGPWEARSAQGLVLRLEQDSFRTRDGYLLSRRYPDGALDTQFGEQGSTVFTLGPDNEGPAALRLDALGRSWVAGASAGRGDDLQAVVLRFGPLGQLDRGYGLAGRSATRPGGHAARAVDLAPQVDGSTYVAGIVTDANGQERSGWWRLLPDGSLDRSFGLGGLWADSGAGSTEVLSIEGVAEGATRLRLRRGVGSDAPIEEWLLPAGSRMPQRAVAVTTAPVSALAAHNVAAAPQTALLSPGESASASGAGAAAPQDVASAQPAARLWLWAAVSVALALAWWAWRRR